jgi:hypothetical protein
MTWPWMPSAGSQPHARKDRVNPHARRAALYAIAAIAIAASANALAHSYAGLYAWALHHRLTGWQAVSWPAEIDVFLAVGELALYVAYLDGWPGRQRVWPWATTLAGLAVSVAGNVGHIQPLPGRPVLLADRFTAAASPLAAFAGLTVGLLVLRMNRQHASAHPDHGAIDHGRLLPAMSEHGNGLQPVLTSWSPGPVAAAKRDQAQQHGASRVTGGCANGLVVSDESALLKDAALLCNTAAARGERLTQRALARMLRGRGHRFPNQSLRNIAVAVGLGHPPGQLPADGG